MVLNRHDGHLDESARMYRLHREQVMARADECFQPLADHFAFPWCDLQTDEQLSIACVAAVRMATPAVSDSSLPAKLNASVGTAATELL